MAKVTIIIEDVEGVENAVNMSYDFTPELPKFTKEDLEDEETVPLTQAQAMALHVYKFLEEGTTPRDEQEGEEEGEEESCSQSEEGTCCGGACHTTEA